MIGLMTVAVLYLCLYLCSQAATEWWLEASSAQLARLDADQPNRPNHD